LTVTLNRHTTTLPLSVYQYAHKTRASKYKCVSHILSGTFKMKQILTEYNKCEVRCLLHQFTQTVLEVAVPKKFSKLKGSALTWAKVKLKGCEHPSHGDMPYAAIYARRVRTRSRVDRVHVPVL
jgi:hypothetical protein